MVLASGSGLLVYLDEHKSIVSHLFIFLVSGIGLGFMLPLLETAFTISVSQNHARHDYMHLCNFERLRSSGLCVSGC